MAVLVDVICNQCQTIQYDKWSTIIDGCHENCGGLWERYWTLTKAPAPGTHASEKVVVYESLKEKNVQFPGRNDVPVPERLRARGYERKELNVTELARFEKKYKVANERRHFNSGNGF